MNIIQHKMHWPVARMSEQFNFIIRVWEVKQQGNIYLILNANNAEAIIEKLFQSYEDTKFKLSKPKSCV